MAVYYKFKSAKEYNSLALNGQFISVGDLKQKIFEIKRLARGTDFDLIITNDQTNQEYLDEGMPIPINTSVSIQRIPGLPRKRIVVEPVADQETSIVENNSDDNVQASVTPKDDNLDWHEFGDDPFAISEPVSLQSSIPVLENTPLSKEDEDNRIKELIDNSALDWQRQPSDGFGPGRGFRRDMSGRNMGGRGFGRVGFEKKTPPEGYICHRCKVPRHLIQHCPTNGDPDFDIKKLKRPTGIPKFMLMASPDGPYVLPNGAAAVLKPNEAEIEGIPSTRSKGELPPELHCPVCNEVMKDSVLTSKCCFTSFCDKCIRDHVISKCMCVCGAKNILADDLLPNKALRDTINRMLESNNSSDEYGGGRSRSFQGQDMESHDPQAKVPSPTQSAASKGQKMAAESSKISEHVSEEKVRTLNVPDASEAIFDSGIVKEAVSQNSALVKQEVQQIPIPGETGKKTIKKNVRVKPDGAKSPCRIDLDHAQENNIMMATSPATFGPYWNSMQQPGFDGFMHPLYPGPTMPPYYMSYGPSPMDIAFRGMLPYQDPFGAMGPTMPYSDPSQKQRDLSKMAMGFNAETPVMSKEKFEARKADLKRKREKEVSSAVDVSPEKSHYKSLSRSTSEHQQRPPHKHSDRHSSPERRSRDRELQQASSKMKSDHYTRQENLRQDTRDHHKHRHNSSSKGRPESQPDCKSSVFLCVSSPDENSARKKRKVLNRCPRAAFPNGFYEEHRLVT